MVEEPLLTRWRAKEAREDLKKLDGEGPGGKLNSAYGDGYFAVSLKKKYGVDSIDELRREVDRVLGS